MLLFPWGGFQGAGESPLPLAPAKEVTTAGTCGMGTLCRAWSKGCAEREGHSPKESTGEPSVTSRERRTHFWLGLPVPEWGGGDPKGLAKGSRSLAQQGKESCQKY